MSGIAFSGWRIALILHRQAVDGGDEPRIGRDDFLQHGDRLVATIQAAEHLGVLVGRIGIPRVGLIDRTELLQGFLVFPFVLIVHPQGEARVKIAGLRLEDAVEGLLRHGQGALRLAHPTAFLARFVSRHIQVGQAEVEARGRPVGEDHQNLFERPCRLRVVVFVEQRRPAIELAQSLGELVRHAVPRRRPVFRETRREAKEDRAGEHQNRGQEHRRQGAEEGRDLMDRQMAVWS